ncbi:uncharacterized protein EAE97_001496 [Botrytis byssoidea]|uniref:Uncharacterized protein n=1 Tax=Botrytis byssoidea TaxID=139641 RepID=A0A9P5IYG2_9HELO|nr:uncharacterized protein EAE97_001496 [Botrytis byssoidea]KAF7951999.1 hypothetical protein EAE97_001496 [Botrytis byssoidea]
MEDQQIPNLSNNVPTIYDPTSSLGTRITQLHHATSVFAIWNESEDNPFDAAVDLDISIEE